MEIDELLEQLRWLFNLPTLATIEEIAAELSKAQALIKSNAEGAAATSLLDVLASKNDEIAALSAQVEAGPDMSKFMPVEVVLSLQSELAALSVQSAEDELEKLIQENDRKLPTPELQAWASKQSVAALSAYLEKAPEIVPRGMQTNGKTPDSNTSKTVEGKGQQEFQASAALQAEFGDEATYLAYCSAQESGSVKILGSKS